jgi:pimeloyl-ACP methyl ester carboxylesterase
LPMPYLEHDGIRFHYETSGEGPALVFSHGLTGSLENARDVLGTVPGYRQILWDARGHGKSEPAGPANGFAFDVFAQDLAALLDHLSISTAIVGGISMGAAVSTRFAIRYPGRVRGLILVRPAWLTEPSPEGLRLMPAIADYLEQFGPHEGRRCLEASEAYQKLLEQSPDTAAGLRDQFYLPQSLERRQRLRAIPGDTPVRHWEEVANLLVPTLVIGNEPDYVHPLSYAHTWAERLPLGRFALVPAKSADFAVHALEVRREIAAFLSSLEESL